eukprot:36_1
MALLVAYTDSEGSSDSDIQDGDGVSSTTTSQSQTNPRKRKLCEINSKDKDCSDNTVDSSSDSDDSDNKKLIHPKRKKMKLPSAKNVLKTKQKSATIKFNTMGAEQKAKKEKIAMLMCNQHTNKQNQDQEEMTRNKNDERYNAELKKNQIENAKYIKHQMKMLNEAEKESKLKKLTQETIRQKNSRKQKRGQANFTLKWDRDCGFEMAGV